MNVAVIGAGLIGAKRCEQVVKYSQTRLYAVVDPVVDRAKKLAEVYSAQFFADFEKVVSSKEVDIVIVCTPNKFLLPIASKALKESKHVLIEKPMCRNLEEAKALADLAKTVSTRLKIGFNHRYHGALREAYALVREGTIGNVLFIKSTYGHGGRPGYDEEWRGKKEICGGGELLDQGVHVIDLIQWFLGPPDLVEGRLAQWVWKKSDVEDNAFVNMYWKDGKIAQFHTSWTQWKNRFQFHIYGEMGSLEIEGLGGSYGTQTLTYAKRALKGGAPTISVKRFEGADVSWKLEWEDFIEGITLGRQFYSGSVESSLAVMETVNKIYTANDKKL